MSIDNIVLPNSNNRYQLKPNGDVIDITELKVLEMNPETLMVKLDWFDGEREYDIRLVLAICKLNIKIPVGYLNQIDVSFIDGTELKIENIYYWFKVPIPYESKEGFHYVPYNTGYAINHEGDLFDIKQNYVRKWYIRKPEENDPKNRRLGYRVTNIKSDDLINRNISRHRALALTYLKYLSYPHKLVVNHIDGIGGNDTLDNLEWCTHSENTLHAYANGLQPNNTTEVLVKETATGKVTKCISVEDASRLTGIRSITLFSRLREHSGKPFKDGWAIKRDDDSEWIDCEPVKSYKKLPVVCFNVFDRTQHIFDNSKEAGYYTKVDDGTILAHIARDSKGPLNGYLFRWFSSELIKQWPTYTEWQLQLFKKPRARTDIAGVLVTDTETKEVELLTTLELVERLGYKLSKVNAHVRRGYSNCKRYTYELVKPY